jgi:hypothetical protein
VSKPKTRARTKPRSKAPTAKTKARTRPAAKAKPRARPAAKAARRAVRERPSRPAKPALPREQRPPKGITRDLFLVFRAPRAVVRNPHDVTNPVWAWLARNPSLSAYQANQHFDGPSSMGVGPCWCNQRFGQSTTTLPDGRVVAIGGEHEDFYDPDFYIYNDVIVTDPSGGVTIYAYPDSAFKPTDGHSATLVGERIVIIGTVGYAGTRVEGKTPVHVLDTNTFAIEPVATEGARPGWISKHTAELAGDGRSIVVRGGEIHATVEGREVMLENTDDWRLDLDTWRWTRLTERGWQQWAIARADGKHNALFDIQSMRWYADRTDTDGRRELARMEREYGGKPDFAVYDACYVPPVAHTAVPEEEASYPKVVRVLVDGVTVRYVEDSWEVWVVVEGALPQDTVGAIVEDLRRKLEVLEKSPCTARRRA